MNIKIYLGGQGWFESSLVMNIKIYLRGQGWFESSLVMNIKINLGGWGQFESSLLGMNIQIYSGGSGWLESSLVMNIKIYLGDRGWFESSLAMNIKIYLGYQGWFGRRQFFSLPLQALTSEKSQGSHAPYFWNQDGCPQWEALDLKNLTENKGNVSYTYIFVFSYFWSFRSSLGARCFWFCKLLK